MTKYAKDSTTGDYFQFRVVPTRIARSYFHKENPRSHENLKSYLLMFGVNL